MTEGWNVFEHYDRERPPKESRGWYSVPMLDSMDVHVIPFDDSIPHDWSVDCVCRPTTTEEDNGGRQILHQPQDGREERYEL